MSTGRAIKKIREIKNLTQEYIAGELGLSRKWYNMLENEEIEIKPDRLKRIAQILKVDVSDIDNFDEKQFLNSVFKDNSINKGTVYLLQKENFEKQKELYEKLLLEKNARINALESLLEFLKKKE